MTKTEIKELAQTILFSNMRANTGYEFENCGDHLEDPDAPERKCVCHLLTEQERHQVVEQFYKQAKRVADLLGFESDNIMFG